MLRNSAQIRYSTLEIRIFQLDSRWADHARHNAPSMLKYVAESRRYLLRECLYTSAFFYFFSDFSKIEVFINRSGFVTWLSAEEFTGASLHSARMTPLR